MLFYLGLATFFFILALSERKLSTNAGGALWCLCFVLLVLFDGLRWRNGTDWEPYLLYFRDCLTEESELDLFEPGFVFLNEAIRSITDNYSVFLVLFAIILYSILFHFLRKYSPRPFFSLFLLFVLMLPCQGMNRQFLAIATCMCSIPLLMRGKKGLFILCVVVGTLFHMTALFFLVALFVNKRFSLKFYITVLLVSVLVCLSNVMGVLSNLSLSSLGGAIGFRLAVYTAEEMESVSIVNRFVGLMMRALIVVPFLFAMYKKTPISREYVFFFNMYCVGVLIYCYFSGTILQIMVARGSWLFNIFQVLLFPYLVLLYRKAFSKGAMMCLLYVYSLLLLVKGIHVYDIGNYNPFIPYTTKAAPYDPQKNPYFY